MSSGIWTAVSGAAAQSQSVDVTANNIANANTLGFKKDEPTFKEYLSTLENEPIQAGIAPRLPIKDKDFYPLDGKDKSYVVMDGTYTNFKQGHLMVTQRPLDLSLDGPGFFEVSTPTGVRYTRQGGFKVGQDGRLVTSEGYPVLSSQSSDLAAALPGSAVQPSQGGQPTQGRVAVGLTPNGAENADTLAPRFINLGETSARISISPSGEIYLGDTLVAKLNVVEFKDRNHLKKAGGGLFEAWSPEDPPQIAAQTQVRQGTLETSNVNPAEEMTKLIQANRMFEQNLKAVKTFDQMMDKSGEIAR